MGRDPATLYYHVNLLERVGIVTICNQRRSGIRNESIYRIKGDRLRVDLKQRSPRFLNALARGCSALLRYAERTCVSALKDDATVLHGKTKMLRLRQVNVRLTKKSLREVNARLNELQEFIKQADSPQGKHEMVITLCVAPVVTK